MAGRWKLMLFFILKTKNRGFLELSIIDARVGGSTNLFILYFNFVGIIMKGKG